MKRTRRSTEVEMGLLGSRVLLLLCFVHLISSSSSGGLSVKFYSKSCPNVEEIVGKVLIDKLNENTGPNPTVPGTLRLFFHDCFVEGCDGSVLIASSSRDSDQPERNAEINLSLAGDSFDVAIKAKKEIEKACPRVVSCADILAILARDVVHHAHGPFWEVEKGRKDGRISTAANAAAHLPRAESNITDLINLFQSKGLNLRDLVTLSGAHNIGFSHCIQFMDRVINGDPAMDPTSRVSLAQMCHFPDFDPNLAIALDQGSTGPDAGFLFGNRYFNGLTQHKGLLNSDQVLFSGGDNDSRKLVSRYAENQRLFFEAFGESMMKMGRIGVKAGSEGEIRKDCTRFN